MTKPRHHRGGRTFLDLSYHRRQSATCLGLVDGVALGQQFDERTGTVTADTVAVA